MRTAESPAARNFAIEATAVLIKRTQELGRPFTFTVYTPRIHRIWRPDITLRNVGYFWRLFSIHGTGTREQKLPGTRCGCELQSALRSTNDRGECVQTGLRPPLWHLCCSGMKDVLECTLGESEAPYVTA